MKIDNYITHLQLRQRGLQKKYIQLLRGSDKAITKGHTDPNYEEITRIRNEMRDADDKLVFLLKLRKEMIKSENNRVQKTSKRR